MMIDMVYLEPTLTLFQRYNVKNK